MNGRWTLEDWEWDLLIDLIRREEDSEPLQSFRECITGADLKDIEALYASARTWRQKRLVIQVIQDQRSPSIQPLMLDVLRAPEEPGDLADVTRAIALCHLEEDFSPERFIRYVDEPEHAMESVRRWLAMPGTTP